MNPPNKEPSANINETIAPPLSPDNGFGDNEPSDFQKEPNIPNQATEEQITERKKNSKCWVEVFGIGLIRIHFPGNTNSVEKTIELCKNSWLTHVGVPIDGGEFSCALANRLEARDPNLIANQEKFNRLDEDTCIRKGAIEPYYDLDRSNYSTLIPVETLSDTKLFNRYVNTAVGVPASGDRK